MPSERHGGVLETSPPKNLLPWIHCQTIEGCQLKVTGKEPMGDAG